MEKPTQTYTDREMVGHIRHKLVRACARIDNRGFGLRLETDYDAQTVEIKIDGARWDFGNLKVQIIDGLFVYNRKRRKSAGAIVTMMKEHLGYKLLSEAADRRQREQKAREEERRKVDALLGIVPAGERAVASGGEERC